MSLTAFADTWSYTVETNSNGKFVYTTHDYSGWSVGTKSNIIFNKGKGNEQTWNILVTAISSSSSNAPSIQNDGNNSIGGFLIGAAAKPARGMYILRQGNRATKVIL